MALRVPCARATRGLRRPSLDARSWGLIQVIRGKRIHTSLEEHLWVVAAALPRRRCVSLHRGCVGEKDGRSDHPARRSEAIRNGINSRVSNALTLLFNDLLGSARQRG